VIIAAALMLLVLGSCRTYTYQRVELAWAYYEAGVAYEGLEDEATAETLYLQAIDLNPELAEARFALTTLYSRNEDFDKALAQAEILYDAADPRFGELLAYVFASTGDNEKAIDLYLELLEDDQRPQLYFNIGLLFLRIDDRSSAVSMLQQAVDIDPAFAPAASVLSGLIYDEGDYQGVILLLKDLAAELTEYPRGAITLLRAYDDAGLYAEYFELSRRLVDTYSDGASLDAEYREIWVVQLRRRARLLVSIAMDDERATEAYRQLFEWEILNLEAWGEERGFLDDHSELAATREYVDQILSQGDEGGESDSGPQDEENT
jgi:tetratricopeptide (TPR) repeat protein